MMSLQISLMPHSPSQTGRCPPTDRASSARRATLKQLSTAVAILFSTLAVTMPVSAHDLTGANTHADKTSDSDPLKASVGRWDENHDGIYTCAEWQAYMTHLFALADIHGSGFLDSKELADVAMREPLFRGASLSFFDSDGDGKISRFEFVGAPSPFFAEFDPEGSCTVTAAALNQGPGKSLRSGKSRTARSAVENGE